MEHADRKSTECCVSCDLSKTNKIEFADGSHVIQCHYRNWCWNINGPINYMEVHKNTSLSSNSDWNHRHFGWTVDDQLSRLHFDHDKNAIILRLIICQWIIQHCVERNCIVKVAHMRDNWFTCTLQEKKGQIGIEHNHRFACICNWII